MLKRGQLCVEKFSFDLDHSSSSKCSVDLSAVKLPPVKREQSEQERVNKRSLKDDIERKDDGLHSKDDIKK